MSSGEPSLKDFQKKFFQTLLDEEAESPPFIQKVKGLGRKERLAVYKNSFRNRIVNGIANDYAVTGLFLGGGDFKNYINNYLQTHPPQSHYLDEVGKNFPEFLRTHTPVGAAEFIHDLAKAEWLMTVSFYDFYDLARSAPEAKDIHINPSLILFKSQWPLHKIWHEEETFPQEATCLALWTLADRRVEFAAFPKLEYQVLKVIQETGSIDEALPSLEALGSTEDIAQILQHRLPEWKKRGILDVV